MLYSIGASWNPDMSQYNRSIKRSMAGLAGIRGLNFAYRLNTWGPKVGPAMMPADDFPNAYIPNAKNLGSVVTWAEGLFGLESAADLLTDAADTLSNVNQTLNAAGTTLTGLINQAQSYGNVSASDVQSKSQAAQAEGAGLLNNLQTLQTASANLKSAMDGIAGTTDKTAAQGAKDSAAQLSGQVDDFLSKVDTFKSDVSALVKYAQSGPGAVQTLENAAVGSISTLTWMVGGGLLIYFFAPTFIPRLASGLRKARTS